MRSASSRQALLRLLEQERRVRGRRRGARPSRADRRPTRRPRHLGQRRLVRRLRVRPAPGLDGAARLDLAHRLLRRRDRLLALGSGGALAVGPDAGRGRVRRARAGGWCADDRAHERARLRARRGGRARPSARRRAGACRRGDQDVPQRACSARAAGGVAAVGREPARRTTSAASRPSSASPSPGSSRQPAPSPPHSRSSAACS